MWQFKIILKNGKELIILKDDDSKDKLFIDLQSFLEVKPNPDNITRLNKSITLQSNGKFYIIVLNEIVAVEIEKAS